jgi:hypothetical protein
MKQKLTLLAVLIMASATWVSAQTGGLASVTIPFEFMVGRTILPAGDYTVDRNASTGILSLHGTSGQADSQLMILSYPVESAQVHKGINLVFDQFGSHRYLSEVRYPGQIGFRVFSMAKNDSRNAMAWKNDSLNIAAQKTE